jgi:hypothetical protein
MFTDLQLKRRFIQSEDLIRWQLGAITQFEQDLVDVQESLFLLGYMTGGLPCRGPEVLSIRYRNTINRGLYNIGVEDRLMFFAPRTHKNYRQ